MSKEKLVIASDHAGVKLKAFLIQNCTEIEFIDLGPNSTDSVDYPDYAEKACKAIQAGDAKRGVLICGSGIGISIAANKMNGIRAAHTETVKTARLAGEHNQANVLCMGERITSEKDALEMLRAWLHAKFGGEGADAGSISRHQKRIDKIGALEGK